MNDRRSFYAIVLFCSAMSIGTGLGISLGVAFNNIIIGLLIGAGAGVAIGAWLLSYFKSKACCK